jgi:hypothetical protein
MNYYKVYLYVLQICNRESLLETPLDASLTQSLRQETLIESDFG